MKRLFDHIDLRVTDMTIARKFYDTLLPALGFPEFSPTSIGICYSAICEHPKPEFIGLIEDSNHIPNNTRIAFWADSKATVDSLVPLLELEGALNIEGPELCPEYSPTYYAIFFEDPCGNKLEICCRIELNK